MSPNDILISSAKREALGWASVSEEKPDGTKTSWLHQPGAYTPGDNAFASFAPSSGYNPGDGQPVFGEQLLSAAPFISIRYVFLRLRIWPRNAIDPILPRAFAVHVEVIVRGPPGADHSHGNACLHGGAIRQAPPPTSSLTGPTSSTARPMATPLESVRSIRTPTSQFDLLHQLLRRSYRMDPRCGWGRPYILTTMPSGG